MKPFIRSAHNYDRRLASREVATVDEGPSLTIQSDKDDADINILVHRFGVTGAISGVARPPLQEQFADVFDFQSAMNLIREADESFSSVDAETRARFNNDPARFVAFCSDPNNLAEMRKMGLAVPDPPPIIEPEPQRVQIVNPEALAPKSDS